MELAVLESQLKCLNEVFLEENAKLNLSAFRTPSSQYLDLHLDTPSNDVRLSSDFLSLVAECAEYLAAYCCHQTDEADKGYCSSCSHDASYNQHVR